MQGKSNGFANFSSEENTRNSNKSAESPSILIQFNFCPQPLNKNNIIKINVEVKETLQLKEALVKALQIFNKNENQKIIEKTEKYKIKLSKKSGMPDLDLPSISETLKLNETNSISFSVIIENEHVMIMPKKKYDPSCDNILTTSATIGNDNSFSSSKKNKMNFNINNSAEDSRNKTQEQSKGCCDFFRRIFSRPKTSQDNLLSTSK